MLYHFHLGNTELFQKYPKRFNEWWSCHIINYAQITSRATEGLKLKLKHISDTLLLRMESECCSGSTKAANGPSSLAHWIMSKEKTGWNSAHVIKREAFVNQVREQSLGEEKKTKVREKTDKRERKKNWAENEGLKPLKVLKSLKAACFTWLYMVN